ncbi:hypothetical protein L218DRAFT_241293 [Marasmius fiardii PR-910]|nr:hypothetical protein L218DRAFT_241293 [Marasmius fiardii PR-910]
MRKSRSPCAILHSGYTTEDKTALERLERNGYLIEHATQPQTLGYSLSLSDSPVGLLAWMYEKLVTWSDKYAWDDDDILTWVSIYWFSHLLRSVANRTAEKTTIPFGGSYFPKQNLAHPALWLDDQNVIFHSHHDKGSRFAAHEVPELLVGDLRKIFGKGGPAYGILMGRMGMHEGSRKLKSTL